MTTDPHLAATVRRKGADAFTHYDLTDREKKRLVAVSRQPGMDLNCTLARGNRFAPIYDAFPLTCTLLGSHLRSVLDELWLSVSPNNYQLSGEIAAFERLLTTKSLASDFDNPYLSDILAYESTCWELAQSLRHGSPSSGEAGQKAVVFRYDLVELLNAMEHGQLPSEGLQPGCFRYRFMLMGDELIVTADNRVNAVNAVE